MTDETATLEARGARDWRQPAKNPPLEDVFRRRLVEKTYQCQVVGRPPKNSGHIENFLFKDAKSAKVFVCEKPEKGALLAVTDYELVKAEGPTSLLRVRIYTGRTHQIRVHMAYLGCPVLGDDKYGDRDANRRLGAKRLCLCACRLRFPALPAPLEGLSGAAFEIEPTFDR